MITHFNKKFKFFLFFLVVFYFFWPIDPAMPIVSLDSSWMFVMNYALNHHFVWGRDIVFTYGFFSYLSTFVYDPILFPYLLILWFFFLFSLLVYLYSFFREQQNFFVQLFLVFIFFWSMTYTPLIFYPVYCMTFFLYVLKERHFNFWSFLGYVLLAVITLIKFSFSLFSFLAVLILAFIDLKQKKFPWGVLCYFVALGLFYKLNYQSFSDFGAFCSGVVQIVLGYNDAMVWSNPLSPIPELVYLFVAIFVCRSFFQLYRYEKFNGLVLFFLVFSLFLMFKNGFTRADTHIFDAFGFELGLILLFFVLCFGYKRAVISVSRSHLIFLLIVAVLEFFISRINIDLTRIDVDSSAMQELRPLLHAPGLRPKYQLMKYFLSAANFDYSLRFNSFASVLNYRDLSQQYQTTLANIRSANPLPKLVGSTDIYSYNQNLLFAYGFLYDPRPIFQSYSAYTFKLLDLNRQHLLSAQAPDNVIFAIQPIDMRYPSLDDSLSWPVLLSRYSLRQFVRNYLWLARNDQSQYAITLRPLSETTYRLGESVQLPSYAQRQLLWAKIIFPKNIFSNLIAMVYKPGQFEINVTLFDGSKHSYHLIGAISASGFLLSPLVENTQDFAQLYSMHGRNHLLSSKQIKSFSITYLGWQGFFIPKDYQVQLFSLIFVPRSM